MRLIWSSVAGVAVLLELTRGLLRVALLSLLCLHVSASWGGNDDETDTSVYGNSLARDWLYNSNAISLVLEGCMWGSVQDVDGAGCMEKNSQDGTTYWYQMANCRRPQAVFSIYASNSGSASCNKNNFKESFVTTNGLSEFIGYLAKYDSNNPFGDNHNGAEDDEYDDDGKGGGDFDDLPVCENGIGLGCADDGTFSLQYFDDQYCLKPSGKTYDKLNSLNRALKTYKNCAGIYYSGNGNNDGKTLPYYLISASESCSSLDSGFCVDNSAMKGRRSHSSSYTAMSRNFGGGKSWVTKLKYATGGLLLVASFVMFTGILFTNRRRRRALLQRKYRQSRSDRKIKSKSSSRSKSKSRDRKSSRSRSRAKTSGDGDGVLA